jgi:hypothetical protein
MCMYMVSTCVSVLDMLVYHTVLGGAVLDCINIRGEEVEH